MTFKKCNKKEPNGLNWSLRLRLGLSEKLS